MDTIFMNSENNKTSHHHGLTLNLVGKYFALSNLSIHYTSDGSVHHKKK